MSQVNMKKVVIAAFVGGLIFCVIVLGIDYIFGRGFSWRRLGFYYIFATIMYGFLTYRSLKKHQK